MTGYFLVFLGGGTGAMLRHGAGVAATKLSLGGAAGATLFVNVVGGFLMGALIGWLLEREVTGEESLWLLLGTGLLGGFTTFSAFSRETVHMIQRGEFARAGLYAGASVALSVIALMVGLYIFRRVFA